MEETNKEPPQKKARTGVGSSVATLVRGETDDLILVLSKIKVERLLPRGRQVITANTGELVKDAFDKLVQNNILSLPVLNQKKKYYGMVEIFDLIEYVTTLFADLSTTKYIDLEKMLISEKKFTNATVRDVMQHPLSKRNQFKSINKGYSLYTAWEILAYSGLHRVPIIDEAGEICDIITQSMLIDFLWQNIEKIGKFADTQVKDMKTKQWEILSPVRSSTKAIVAFREMVRREKGGLAILDENGELIDNISARDLRGIHTDATVFWRLWSTVTDFKTRVRNEYSQKTPSELIYAIPSDTLYSIIEKMAIKHIHRVYVVDTVETMRPVRVITQTDILREIIS